MKQCSYLVLRSLEALLSNFEKELCSRLHSKMHSQRFAHRKNISVLPFKDKRLVWNLNVQHDAKGIDLWTGIQHSSFPASNVIYIPIIYLGTKSFLHIWKEYSCLQKAPRIMGSILQEWELNLDKGMGNWCFETAYVYHWWMRKLPQHQLQEHSWYITTILNVPIRPQRLGQ